MDYFSKALGSLNIGLPFTLGEEIRTPEQSHVVHEAIWKKDSSEVTTFQYSTKCPLETSRGNNARQVLRKLKLPGVVKYVDTVETFDTMFLVVERVNTFQFDQLSLDAAKFVLLESFKALQTIFDAASCQYGDSLAEIMQAKATGLPVLAVFDNAHFIDKSSVNTAGPRYCPIMNRGQLQSLLTTVLQHHQDLQFELLKLCGLQTTNNDESYTRRHDFGIQKVISRLKTPISDLVNDIDSTLLMETHQLTAFCDRVDIIAPSLWPGIIKGTILPAIIKTNKPVVLRTCLKLITHLQDTLKDDEVVTKFIVKQFESMDRVVRLEMLKYLPDYIHLISPKVVQTSIMPKLAFGFTDSEVIMRRISVASVEVFASKLSSRQLNTDLLRLLAKTHSDTDPEVRALTTTVLCKVAPQLDSRSVISTALGRALKDPVPKCRQTALQCVLKVDAPAREVAEKLLGPAALGMLDKDPQVSAEAWHVTDTLLSRIQKEATASSPSTGETISTFSTVDTYSETPDPKSFGQSPLVQNQLQQPMIFNNSLTNSSRTSVNSFTSSPMTDLKPASAATNTLIDNEVEDAWGWDEEEESFQSVPIAQNDAEAVDNAWRWND